MDRIEILENKQTVFTIYLTQYPSIDLTHFCHSKVEEMRESVLRVQAKGLIKILQSERFPMEKALKESFHFIAQW